MKSCANAITSEAQTTNSSFPFHTVEDFETLGNTIRKFSNSEIFGFAPILTVDELLEWSQYSMAHQDWIQRSRELILEAHEGTLVNSDYKDGSITPGLYELENGTTPVPAKIPAPFFTPLWQTSPPPFDPATVNMNLRSMEFVSDAIEAINKTREAVLTFWPPLTALGALAVSTLKPEDHEIYHRQFVTWEGDHPAFNNPHLFLFEPVFAKLHRPESKLVGFVMAVLAWDVYVTKLLPDGVDGIYVVLRNSCDQNMTYELRGTSAHYLGDYDAHDPAYDDTELVVPFGRYTNSELVMSTPGHCTYTFHIYASGKFEKRYRSDLPTALTVSPAGCVFDKLCEHDCECRLRQE